jgi:hypothetical protein
MFTSLYRYYFPSSASPHVDTAKAAAASGTTGGTSAAAAGAPLSAEAQAALEQAEEAALKAKIEKLSGHMFTVMYVLWLLCPL